uniref:t-SNARE coiled-coil homology domain-containing protein n=1 Tax=Mimiviridae sp. ChoanoV1 TaxID=2596887 RepID=A0A5B8IDS3_9VIRU|nr:hypothetical protein 2_18 [Mimiviridae sp. ChoanoV1]
MDKIEYEIDKNLIQMSKNHSILKDQDKKIKNINNNIDNIEKDNSISKQIIHRLNSLYHRFMNPIKNANNNQLSLNLKDLDRITQRNQEILKINDNFNSIMSKVSSMKDLSLQMGETLDEQNDILDDTSEKMDNCITDIKINTELIKKII